MESNQVVLITGANSGFGLACAKALAERGFRVYGTYRNPRKAGPLRDLAAGLPVFPVLMDVNRTASVEKGVGRVLKREGKIDVLLNNAGFVVAGFWEDLSEEDTLAQFETNVFGVLRLARAVLPSMRKRGSGKIINIGSIAAFAATPVLGAYSATKSAVNSITEALRMETREWGVDVTEINPGEIQTNVVENTRLGRDVRSKSSPYRAFTESFERFAQERFRHAAPVGKLVQTVLKAVGDHPTKRRYLVKFEDRILYWMRWLMPDAVWEWALGLTFPWSKRV